MTKPISNSVAINRRDVLKALMLRASCRLPASELWLRSQCNVAGGVVDIAANSLFLRHGTDAEKQRDAELFAETFFREHELLTLAVLCDIILPSNHENGGALDAGLPDFC